MKMTNGIGRCLATSSGGLNEHIPVIIIKNDGTHMGDVGSEDEDNCSGIKSESRNDNRKRHMPNASSIDGTWRGICADGTGNRG